MRIHQLTEQQILGITKELSDMTIESQLKSQVNANIGLKKEIGSYAGYRHAMGLPVRGQRTKNNARTAKVLNRLNRR